MTNVALEQMCTKPGDAEGNLTRMLDRCAAQLSAGAEIIVFPELAAGGYSADLEAVSAVAEPVNGPTVTALCRAVAGHDALVVVGLCERDGDRFFNTVVMVDGDGVRLHYRKLHLFDQERLVFTPGDHGLPVVDTKFGRLGVCVCYDLRFVEVLRLLSLRDADIVLAPAAWVGGFDAAVPASGLSRQAEGVVAQANLNQVAVVAVSQVGQSAADGPIMLGGSLAVDAYGEVVAGALSRTEEGSAMAVIDIERGRRARRRGDLIKPREERRRDVYSLHFEGEDW